MPAQRLPWIKFWPEALDHEKFSELSDSEAWTWVVVWAKASLQPNRWRFSSIHHAAHVSGRKAGQIRKLISVGLIDEVESGLVIHDARDWQDASSLTPNRREPSVKGDGILTERWRKGDATLTNKHTKGGLEGEGEGDIEKDVVTPPVANATSPSGKRRRVTEVDDALRQELVETYMDVFGSRQAVVDVIDTAMGHKARDKCSDQKAYLRGWVRRDAQRVPQRNGRNHLAAVERREDPVVEEWRQAGACCQLWHMTEGAQNADGKDLRRHSTWCATAVFRELYMADKAQGEARESA